MTRSAATSDVRTYVPDEQTDAQIVDFVRALKNAGGSPPEVRPALVSADGTRHEIPEALFDVLTQVADAMDAGMGVTVAPMNALLTTQEAANFLGISRPTLVRTLERGEVPMEKPGRHRFVRLADLVEYQERQRNQTRDALEEMVRDAEEAGLYDQTDRLPPPTR